MRRRSITPLRCATVVTDGWAGRVEHPVYVIAETPKRYRCMFRGPFRGHPPGSVTLVPKHAVRFENEAHT